MEWLSPMTRETVGLLKDAKHLRQGQSAAHVSAHSIVEHQDPIVVRIVLHLRKLRQDMLILGGLSAARQVFMAFDLPDNGQQMDPSLPPASQGHLAVFPDPFLLVLFFAGIISHKKNSFPTQFFLFCVKKELSMHSGSVADDVHDL